VDEWKQKKLKAEKKFKDAEADWNKYNAATANAASTVPAPLSGDQANILTKQGFTNPDGSARTPTATELNKLSGKDLLQLQQAGVDKTPTTTTGSSYDVNRYSDLRGAARLRMDEAQVELDEATKMVESVLPDEARKAGAPPGWAR
jgi:hypothetical protein